MKLVSEIQVTLHSGDLPDLLGVALRSDLQVHSLRLVREERQRSLYQIQMVYESKERFSGFLDMARGSGDKFSIDSVVDLLEEQTIGGLLTVSSKLPIESYDDFEIRLLGATELILEKIREGNGLRHSGISKNVAVISGFRFDNDIKINTILEAYARAEEDSVIINMFTGLNAYPLIVNFDHEEDLIKTIQRVESTFSAVKLNHLEGIDTGFYDQMLSDVTVPVLSVMYDDIPLCVMTVFSRLIVNHRLKTKDITVGFIGVDLSVMRLTRILMKADYYRVLGNDVNERVLLSFEKNGGLATTNENILINADIIVLMKDMVSPEEMKKIRPGVMLVSFLPDEAVNPKVLADRGVREYILCGRKDVAALSPGMIKGALDSGLPQISDSHLVSLSRKIGALLSDTVEFPEIFSDVHERIAEIIKKM
ncbi:MAG: hypothetical protein JXA20_00560 [Spirochaetes bacterium]|nr:hypothetical protein [Spirochaetota bacterium]